MSQNSDTTLRRIPELSIYCPFCTTCFEKNIDVCEECGSDRPKEGWSKVEGSPFSFLGMSLDERYSFVQFLGDGATGYVYRAQSTKIYRDFAAKIVDTSRYGKEKFQQELIRRFELEVEAMSQLRNPHVVAIYESLRIDENLYVLLMDYVDGRTLQNLLDRVGRIKHIRALEIIRQIANGLYEAHLLGFIHRDLKPDNIMIERLPVEGFFARVLDFGIVHWKQETNATQGFRGTPLYASPEQCTGDPNIDARADVYGLGCVLFHCLTGVPPYPGRESLLIMDHHVNSPPPKLSSANEKLGKIKGLETLLDQMLAKDPDDRPNDMGEVVKIIDSILVSINVKNASLISSSESKEKAKNRNLPTADFAKAKANKTNPRAQLIQPIIEFQISDMQKIAGGIFTAVSLVSSGHLAVVADRNNNVHLIGMRNDGYFETFIGAKETITSVTLDRSVSYVFASTLSGDLLRWSISQPTHPPRLLKSLSDRIYSMEADFNELVCGADSGKISIIDVESGRERVIVEHGPPSSVVSMSSERHVIFAAGWDKSLRMISFDGKITELDALPDNGQSIITNKLVTAVLDKSGGIRTFGKNPDKYFDIATHVNLCGIVFSPDGRLLACSNKDGSFQLSDFRNEALMYQFDDES